MSSSSTYEIEKLRGPENYAIWAFKMERILQEKLGSFEILSDKEAGEDEEQRNNFIKFKSQDDTAITTMTIAMQE